jgi:predicted HicB family RNase H-like nuclease
MQLDKILARMPASTSNNTQPIDKNNMTAIQLVSNFNGFGVHTLFSIVRSFQGLYKNFVFISIAVVDQGSFKGKEGLDDLKKSTEESLKKYVELARAMGYPAEYRMAVGTDVVDTATDLCQSTSMEFSKSTIFSGRLAFRFEKYYHRLLHNETAFAIQRRLQWSSITNVILPIRMEI